MLRTLYATARGYLERPAARLALGTVGMLYAAKLLQDLGADLAAEKLNLMHELGQLREQRDELAAEVRQNVKARMHQTAATMAERINAAAPAGDLGHNPNNGAPHAFSPVRVETPADLAGEDGCRLASDV